MPCLGFGYIRVYTGDIGVMEKKRETTILFLGGLGLRVWDLRLRV